MALKRATDARPLPLEHVRVHWQGVGGRGGPGACAWRSPSSDAGWNGL